MSLISLFSIIFQQSFQTSSSLNEKYDKIKFRLKINFNKNCEIIDPNKKIRISKFRYILMKVSLHLFFNLFIIDLITDFTIKGIEVRTFTDDLERI